MFSVHTTPERSYEEYRNLIELEKPPFCDGLEQTDDRTGKNAPFSIFPGVVWKKMYHLCEVYMFTESTIKA